MGTVESRLLPMVQDRGPSVPPVFERIAIVGLGLVGGSIALAARKVWPASLVIGVDRNAVLERAMIRHAIDVASEDLMIISDADLVILATPVEVTLDLIPALDRTLVSDAVVTDVASTKSDVGDCGARASAAAPVRRRASADGRHRWWHRRRPAGSLRGPTVAAGRRDPRPA